eukprot:GHVU01035572.1.p2 GENE.GHVU01035572.1~~GHVU01035572.1.p2  ORF type:complete len:379 (-),score=92.52 GHVU01035572.1:337-1473(-)
MQLLMSSHCFGFLICDMMMAYCVVFCDWQKLSDKAVANATEEEKEAQKAEEEDDKATRVALEQVASATESQHKSHDSAAAAASADPENALNIIPESIPPDNASAEMPWYRNDRFKERAIAILDEWMDRWNALDPVMWSTSSIRFNPDTQTELSSSSSLEDPLLQQHGTAAAATTDISGGRPHADKFGRLLTPLRDIGWHHSAWSRREWIGLRRRTTDRVQLLIDTTCLRFSEDNSLLGEFASSYEIRPIEGSELWEVRWVGDWAQTGPNSETTEDDCRNSKGDGEGSAGSGRDDQGGQEIQEEEEEGEEEEEEEEEEAMRRKSRRRRNRNIRRKSRRRRKRNMSRRRKMRRKRRRERQRSRRSRRRRGEHDNQYQSVD